MNDAQKDTKGPSQGNVLLLDDDKFLLDMYSMKFTKAGFTVQACLSVEDALRALKGGFHADAVVLDLIMPERDGFSFLEAIETEHVAPDTVKIALTNQGNDEDKERAEKLGVDRYIVKASMIPSEVLAVVQEEITKKKGKKS